MALGIAPPSAARAPSASSRAASAAAIAAAACSCRSRSACTPASRSSTAAISTACPTRAEASAFATCVLVRSSEGGGALPGTENCAGLKRGGGGATIGCTTASSSLAPR